MRTGSTASAYTPAVLPGAHESAGHLRHVPLLPSGKSAMMLSSNLTRTRPSPGGEIPRKTARPSHKKAGQQPRGH